MLEACPKCLATLRHVSAGKSEALGSGLGAVWAWASVPPGASMQGGAWVANCPFIGGAWVPFLRNRCSVVVQCLVVLGVGEVICLSRK